MTKIVIMIAIALLATTIYTANSGPGEANRAQENSAAVKPYVPDDPAVTVARQYDPIISEIIGQQQESRENMRRLAEGQIKELKIDGPAEGDETEKNIHVTVAYADGSTLGGLMTLRKHENQWILSKVTRADGAPTVSTLPRLTDQEQELGSSILKTQTQDKNQESMEELLTGKLTGFKLLSLEPKDNEVTINAKAIHEGGREEPATITMKQLNGFWYLVGLETHE